jgi:hypothetical protein
MLGAGAADPAAVSSFEMVTFAKKSRIFEGFPDCSKPLWIRYAKRYNYLL